MIRFLLVALVALASPAIAQAPDGVTAEIEKIAEAARAQGMTVVVMSPAKEAAPVAVMDTMRAERFLAARARLREIAVSAETLPEALALTLQRIGAMAKLRGNAVEYGWLLRGLGTALLGAFIGWLAIRPLVRWSARNAARFRERWGLGTHDGAGGETHTTADRARALLLKTGFAVTFAVLIYAVALLVAVLLDSGFEPTRRVIFECLTAFLIYRLLRFGFSWPMTAYDDPENRLVGLDDEQAQRMYRSFSGWVALTLVPAVVLRFFIAEGASDGPYGALTSEHIALLAIIGALLGTLSVVGVTLSNWRATKMLIAPHVGAPVSAWTRVARGLAHAVPAMIIAYTLFSLVSFLFRLGAGLPDPGATIIAPFVIGYVALIAYGVALIVIQAIYGARESRYLARMERERRERIAARAADLARLADGEEMTVSHDAMDDAEAETPVFRPLLRSFFEQAVLVTVLVVAAGELARWWGVPVGTPGNSWAGLLDMVLALALAWIGYRAVTVAVDRRLAEEAGPEVDEDSVGNEGGAGASRLATLLPIMRWVIVAIIVVAAIIMILSRFGIDIGPLLASAGVVGIAVGFGAQKLIQDIFSGAFFLLDDAFRRGEYIDIEGTKGTVEKISIRSFQLRHHLGALHTIPFGEIKQLTNFSRDWVLMKLPLRVTYDTDVEKVRKLIKKLGQSLLEHPEIGHTFMQPLKSQGVYKMEDSAMIIRVKFMTKPGEQFVTRKVVYAAIQELFAREGIRFAHKEVTVRLADGEVESLTEDQKQAVTSAAREVIDAEEAAEAAAENTKGGR